MSWPPGAPPLPVALRKELTSLAARNLPHPDIGCQQIAVRWAWAAKCRSEQAALLLIVTLVTVAAPLVAIASSTNRARALATIPFWVRLVFMIAGWGCATLAAYMARRARSARHAVLGTNLTALLNTHPIDAVGPINQHAGELTVERRPLDRCMTVALWLSTIMFVVLAVAVAQVWIALGGVLLGFGFAPGRAAFRRFDEVLPPIRIDASGLTLTRHNHTVPWTAISAIAVDLKGMEPSRIRFEIPNPNATLSVMSGLSGPRADALRDNVLSWRGAISIRFTSLAASPDEVVLTARAHHVRATTPR